MRSTVARRLSTLAGFYRYCHTKGILERNPAADVRRPKVDHESRTLGLDRNELGALLVQAGLGTPRDHALITLLVMNGLWIAEALGVDIDDLAMDRGHRTLHMDHQTDLPHTASFTPSLPPSLDASVPLRDVLRSSKSRRPAYDDALRPGPVAASTATEPTSCRRSSRGPPDRIEPLDVRIRL